MAEEEGSFIVLEGIDGCGKSSQVLGVIDFFLKKDKYNHVLVTREPYKKRELREILKQDNNAYSQARKLADLFVDDRKEHIKEIILPALEKNLVVISDRYKYSTIVYQSVQGIPVQELIEMHKNMPVPDLVFIFDIPVDVAEKRMSKDNRQEHKFEADKKFQEKLRQKYLEMPKIFPEEKIVVIDGTKTIEEISEEIIEIFKSLE